MAQPSVDIVFYFTTSALVLCPMIFAEQLYSDVHAVKPVKTLKYYRKMALTIVVMNYA